MTFTFQELIQKVELTKKERLIADYVMNNFRELCYMTSTELAETLKISYSSVIRFTKDLGFSGYTEFQQYIRDQYNIYLNERAESADIPVVKLDQSLELLSQDDISSAVKNNAFNNILSVNMHNPTESFEQAGTAIIHSKHKYIVGSRGSAAAASFLSIMLKDTLPGVCAEPHGALNTFDFLSDIGKEDCLIAVSYPRYSKLTLAAAKMAHNAGAKIIVITDTPTAPLAKYATYLFTSSIDSLTFFNSQIPALYTAELLCTYICKKTEGQNKEKLHLIDRYTSELGLY